jgi:hypothetical protein
MAATCAHDDDCEFAKPAAWLGRAKFPRVPPRRRGQYPFNFPQAASRAAKWDARPAYAACYAATLHNKPRLALHAFMHKLLENTNRDNAAFAVDWDRVVEHFRVAVQAAHNASFLSRVYKMYAYDALSVAGVSMQPVLVVKTILAVPVFELQQIALRTNALVLHNVTPHIALTHHVGRVLRNDAEHRPRQTYVTGLIVSEASGQRSLDAVLRDDFGIHATHIVATDSSLSAAKKRQLYSIFAQVTHGLFALSYIQLKRDGAGACWHHCDMKPANVAYCSVEPGAALTYAYTHNSVTQKLRGITGVCRLIDFDTMSTNFDSYCFSNPQRYVAARRQAFRRDIGAWMRAVGRPASRSRSRSRGRRAKTPDRGTPVIMDLVSFLVSMLPRHSSARRQNFYSIPVAAFIVDVIRKLLQKHGDATDPARDTRVVLWKVFCYFCAKANRGTADAAASEHFGEAAPRESRSQIQHELQQLQQQAPVEEPRQLAPAAEAEPPARSRSRSRPRSRSRSRRIPLAEFRRSARITALPQERAR